MQTIDARDVDSLRGMVQDERTCILGPRPSNYLLDTLDRALNSIEVADRTFKLLVEAGHINAETVEKARHLAATLK